MEINKCENVYMNDGSTYIYINLYRYNINRDRWAENKIWEERKKEWLTDSGKEGS